MKLKKGKRVKVERTKWLESYLKLMIKKCILNKLVKLKKYHLTPVENINFLYNLKIKVNLILYYKETVKGKNGRILYVVWRLEENRQEILRLDSL